MYRVRLPRLPVLYNHFIHKDTSCRVPAQLIDKSAGVRYIVIAEE